MEETILSKFPYNLPQKYTLNNDLPLLDWTWPGGTIAEASQSVGTTFSASEVEFITTFFLAELVANLGPVLDTFWASLRPELYL